MPVEVLGLGSGAAAVAAGDAHSCALTDAGAVQCWGNSGLGQLGDGNGYWVTGIEARGNPVDVVGLGSGVAALSTGYAHNCALKASGGLKCWGFNDVGQLAVYPGPEQCSSTPGGSPLYCSIVPVDIGGMSNGVTAVDASWDHTCAVKDGGLHCWGGNGLGQVGDGTTTTRIAPTAVVGMSAGVAMAAGGSSFSCALTTAGGVKCWGINNEGQLGQGTTTGPETCGDSDYPCSRTPVSVSGLSSGVAALTAGDFHACVVTTSGGVKCWGYNGLGQLGNGSTQTSATPVDVVGLSSGVVAVSAGHAHTCALRVSGGVKCWGSNWGGELGDGTTTQRNTPVDVVGLSSGVAAVSAGGGTDYEGSHTCAVTAGGAVKCWGLNDDGQLGDGAGWLPADVAGFEATSDADGDGVLDASDNCPTTANPAQTDDDGDLRGDECEAAGSGNVDCDSGVNSIDVLKVLRYSAALSVVQSEPCLDIGVARALPAASDWMMGDVNCSDSVNSVDALLIARVSAGLSVSLPGGCPPIKPP
jgi:alpha-tubulin suppressor-like RCC1 family protein